MVSAVRHLVYMIADDQELKATQERIVRFQRWLAQMHQTARAGELGLLLAVTAWKLSECRPRFWTTFCARQPFTRNRKRRNT